MGDRTRTALLAILLVAAAGILGGIGALVPIHIGHNSTVIVTPVYVSEHGKLLVTAQEIEVPNVLSSSSSMMPISGVNVTLSLDRLALYSGETNSSGEVEITATAGTYLASLASPDFHASIVVLVRQDNTTRLSATLTKQSFPALFTSLPDPESTDSVAPWSSVSMAMALSPPVPLNNSLFLEVNPTLGNNSGPTAIVALTSVTGSTSSLTPVELISANPGEYGGTAVEWLTLQPEAFVPLSGLFSINLATFIVSLSVTPS